MKNILCIVPDLTDATSYYRAIGPFSHLRRDMDINFNFLNGINWPVIKMHDAVFIQRPSRKEDLQIAQMTKENHRPLWIDFDDDLFNVPTDNPSHKIYSSPNTLDIIHQVISMADIVTVSTPGVLKAYSHLNDNIVVVPNGLDDDLLKNHEIKYDQRKKTIMWRGSNTHERDLMSVSKEIIELSKESNFQLQFLGYNPWFITDHIQNYHIDYGRDLPGYFRYIKEQQPGYFIQPLLDNTFNKSKSNIAWLEATYAGAPCLAPALPEWNNPGCILYKDPSDFKNNLNALTKGDINSDQAVKESWNYIKETLTMKKTNELRKSLLLNLLA